jgi:hypothetical protein
MRRGHKKKQPPLFFPHDTHRLTPRHTTHACHSSSASFSVMMGTWDVLSFLFGLRASHGPPSLPGQSIDGSAGARSGAEPGTENLSILWRWHGSCGDACTPCGMHAVKHF